jgi:hypothetical protein
MVFNATFNNISVISWQCVLLVEEKVYLEKTTDLLQVTNFEGCAPLVVIAVIKLSSSSRFSFNFFTKLSMARLAKLSLSPPCLWHIKL